MKEGFFDEEKAATAMKLLIMRPAYLFTCSDMKLEQISKQIAETRAAFNYHERRPFCQTVDIPPTMFIMYKKKFDCLETLIKQTLFKRERGLCSPVQLDIN